ncbi:MULTISPECIES: phosphomannomutase [Acinetobacter calcoaceticus/baumannii complex]|uniref:phosphomannomutase n=1 Tax=Acinetobacter calcoaceticus/baumannii complex TaxID=909768 RepID=UPI0003B8A72A|nr:phosphomannomutase [Acinetobacter pittii]MDP7844929.1 hypothetical protein [Acinetobacter pittii]MDP7871395.1 hypothetical protein [Acinetobacter pittii]CDI28255.1 phosphomannomutase [Acinetobacter pittii 42F]
MVRKYFGTDGIRGKANEGAMTAETALRVGMAAGRVFRRGDHRHRVVIGKDTRLSGYMLEPALTAGFTSMGMDVFLFGPLPTTYVLERFGTNYFNESSPKKNDPNCR